MNTKLSVDTPLKTLFDLSGRVALVTGGAGHLGKALVYALAELGAHVVIASRSKAHCDEAVQELIGRGFKASALEIDIHNEASQRQAVDQLLAAYGRFDVLVNNAYPFLEKSIDDISNDEFTNTIDAALAGTFRLSQLASLAMRKSDGGSVINIASMYGMVGSYPEVYKGTGGCISPAYHAAKGGLLQLTRYLAVYWAEFNIRVNSISPGAFPKDSVKKDKPEFAARLEDKIPLRRFGHPAELKGAVALLASDAGRYLTGANIIIDGGWTAW